MKALLPAYYIALTGACGVATATAFYQMILILIFLTEKILLLFLLPAIRMYLVLELINFLTKEEFLSKMTELLKNGILWALKSMIGVIVGIQLIQRMISPAAAVVQPVTDKRMVGCIHTMGESLGLLVRLLLTMEILFLLTIAILAGSLQ